ncbi:gephyrin-like molybdotransferase Glp [Ferrimicrobium sp.]|uniref:molybdopterin molybdotransferase MoeA n=1 Tax=Ferrimicrobium sp. TaxID=2926050 RepID=UPI00261E679D|nr:gephyrin-like molybdotransferase Glp [Ferrimicrobium sp.]
MRPLEEVINHTLANVTRLPEVQTPLGEAGGLYLAGPTLVKSPIPPFDNTAVDGYAIRLDAGLTRTSTVLHVIGTVAAGDDPSELVVNPGEAIRIMTGAPIPPGTDAVVMVEDTTSEGDAVRIHRLPQAGENIRRAGSDIPAGQYVFGAGTKITPAVRGVLASLGATDVTTFARPTIGVISTGDELSDAEILAPGKIHDSNRPALLDSVAALGAVAVDLGNVGDDPEAIRYAFETAVETCDALITSGGVSVGDFDYTKAVLRELSDNQITWFQVAIKPAKPFAFGRVGDTPVFGLPGNPVSALVSFELFVRPSILQMLGAKQLFRPTLQARTTVTLDHKPDGKLHLIRGLVEQDGVGGLRVTPQGQQGSHVLTGLAQSNAFILLPDGAQVPSGEGVEVLLIGSLDAETFSPPGSPHTEDGQR